MQFPLLRLPLCHLACGQTLFPALNSSSQELASSHIPGDSHSRDLILAPLFLSLLLVGGGASGQKAWSQGAGLQPGLCSPLWIMRKEWWAQATKPWT